MFESGNIVIKATLIWPWAFCENIEIDYLFIHCQTNDWLLSTLPLCFKRWPYIKYKNYPETVEKVKHIYIENVSGIAFKSGFKEKTLYNWRKMLLLKYNCNSLEK